MTDYKPGTVAKATVRGQKDVLVMRTHGNAWAAPIPVDEWTFHGDSDVTDVRPLVLLDLENPAYTIEALRESATHKIPECGRSYDETLPALADQIEAQTKPPRIPEPGLWGVVEAGCVHADARSEWVHSPYGWIRLSECAVRSQNADAWDDLIDPTLIREGVES